VADEEDVAATGGEGEGIERAAAELVGDLRLERESLAGESCRVHRPHLRTGQAGVDLGAHRL
jgi:hypothetical protein